ncbi:MAG TPA: thiolase family protein [Candidatus Nanoarchaeia archaeon]|nr:thiolase family protein [Candidatus Nanoarchaeia archaeon]
MMHVKGVGMTKFGIHSKTTHELCYEAAMDALEDADISPDKIDAVFIARGDCATDGERQRLFPSLISSIMQKEGIPLVQVMAACAGGGAAFWNAVHSGYNTVLVLGVEKLTPPPTPQVTDDLMTASERLYEQTEGLNFPAQNALIAQQYMRRYGVSTDDFALVALKNHGHATLNPKARFYGKTVTLDMIKKSPVICSPLRLFDCSISVDGAAAAIITKEKTDIEIAGSSLCADRLPAFEASDMTSWEATKLCAAQAYREAGISPKDIDCVELHDAFTPVELMAYEDLGFCEKGEGKKLIRKGRTKLNGDLPVNMSGGLKAKGHPISATGVSQIYELTKQLRNQADKRQVDNPRIGIAHNVGGVGSSVTVHVLRKGG